MLPSTVYADVVERLIVTEYTLFFVGETSVHSGLGRGMHQCSVRPTPFLNILLLVYSK